jgi:hypothetical protein
VADAVSKLEADGLSVSSCQKFLNLYGRWGCIYMLAGGWRPFRFLLSEDPQPLWQVRLYIYVSWRLTAFPYPLARSSSTSMAGEAVYMLAGGWRPFRFLLSEVPQPLWQVRLYIYVSWRLMAFPYPLARSSSTSMAGEAVYMLAGGWRPFRFLLPEVPQPLWQVRLFIC